MRKAARHFLAVSLLFHGFSAAQNLTDDQLSQVKQRLAEGALQSWELGTRAQALTELDTPAYSVLTVDASLPPSQSSPPSSLDEVFGIAKSIVGNRSVSNDHVSGAQPLIADSAAGDPASIGVAVLLANWTGQASQDKLDYAGAATDQLNYLFNDVPHTSDGAISHRVSQLQLWSDFVYMVPPFLSYYGVVTSNQSMLQQGYNQIKLYRQYLRDGSAGGLWKHIVMGSGTDEGHWSTGNAWAAAGMLRVLGTISRSQFANNLKGEQSDLSSWTLSYGLRNDQRSSKLFGNYADDNSTFDDASSATLLASTVYRLALLSGNTTFLPQAEQVRQAIFGPATSSGSNNGSSLEHFTSDMWLTPVVNPHSFGDEGSESPEGQAFVVELDAAWRDWVQAGSPGVNSAYAMARANWCFWVVISMVLVAAV
ncbi:hypothetical protein EW026_g3969 [Hermanssonia centrifuga]|uniref:Uncharacterized protein n=1 Tax=Hermanssonia centrifuga TaxID=98765 RepID=A0A4S4KIL0_9APHY|nr:hypothetical protein EW026_g3969 [Hermanssonia centrifuga]